MHHCSVSVLICLYSFYVVCSHGNCTSCEQFCNASIHVIALFRSSFYCNSVCSGHLLNHASTLKCICVMYCVGCSKITGVVW